MQRTKEFVNEYELDRLARRFQRLANALFRLARVSHENRLMLKLGTISGTHLARIERAASRVCGDAATQVDPEIGRSLII